MRLRILALEIVLCSCFGCGDDDGGSDESDGGDSAENTVATCQDNLDNDGDSYVDCDDQDCQVFVFCLEEVDADIERDADVQEHLDSRPESDGDRMPDTDLLPDNDADAETVSADADAERETDIDTDIDTDIKLDGDMENDPQGIDEHPSLLDNLIAYYPFDTDADDAHGSYHGTPSGVTLQTGIQGDCYSYNGTYSCIDIPIAVSESGNLDFSSSLWVKAPEQDSLAALFITMTPDEPWTGHTVYFNHPVGNVTYRLDSNNTLESGNVSQVDDDAWHHWVFVRSGSQLMMYVDGGLLSSQSVNNINANDANYGLRFGAHALRSDFQTFEGEIDEVGFWHRALTEAEILDLYNEGDGFPYSTTI